MIDLDIEPRRGALAPNDILALINGPKHAKLGGLVADQETGQHAQGWIDRDGCGRRR